MPEHQPDRQWLVVVGHDPEPFASHACCRVSRPVIELVRGFDEAASGAVAPVQPGVPAISS